MPTIKHTLAVIACVAALAGAVHAADAPKTFAAATAGLTRLDGLAPVYLDKAAARVLIALPAAGGDGVAARWLYQVYLRAGLGSTPVGLDRSEPGPTQIIVFRRVGGKILAEYENDGFRADGGSVDEKRAVADSFPRSTVWAGDIIAEGPDHALLVDITAFLGRDAFGVVDALKTAKQGAFKLDAALTHPELADVLAFPENLEFEASETFTSDEPGAQVQAILPDAHAVTLVVHHSLIALPPPGFTPRLSDPRIGAIDHLVADYGAPLGAPVVYRLAHRFRLEKTDPTAARSPVKKPIVFWVDRAAPQPIRDALVEGARWWAAAFDAAGFIDAFRVDVLPEGVSPLDARYNVINWVHRQTRGWSYGEPIVDPRTGEIVKGSVLLGSLRVRQDRMIYEGLLGADKTGTGGPNDPIQISLARLRQLAVHETGHAIGFNHNFAGSTFDDRASVMDYPPPRVGIVDGRLDFSDAYGKGVGAWDRFALAWLYSQFPPGVDEKAALEAMVRAGYGAGMKFVSDEDSRPAGSAHPDGALWDDGPDAVAGLRHVMEVRRIALANFGLNTLPAGAPAADLRRVIVPIYLFHRYEADAAAKLIGGVDFDYAVAGDGHETAVPVSGARQRAALAALLATVDPAALDLPDPLLNLLSDGQSGASDPQFDAEVFGDAAKPVFELPAAAEVAADITFADILAPERLNRVADMGARDPHQMQLGELLTATVDATFPADTVAAGRLAELRRRTQARLIIDLARTLADKRLSPSAAARVSVALTGLAQRLRAARPADPADLAQARYFADLILDPARDGVKLLAERDAAQTLKTPPGMPIGEDCWLCEVPAIPAPTTQ